MTIDADTGTDSGPPGEAGDGARFADYDVAAAAVGNRTS